VRTEATAYDQCREYRREQGVLVILLTQPDRIGTLRMTLLASVDVLASSDSLGLIRRWHWQVV